ncbi:hypothetical protein CMI38_04900 [Candidatus Pacearchaeota archaeon]|nr:hypothetical protein [Candidatus Pacearchaeota archaeon]|tara:strand:+ start:567 stop:992 length:426 start_codon:yes stop_codon:yes gene_type:complete
MLIVLPYIQPPRQAINIAGIEFQSMPESKLGTESEAIWASLYGFELRYVYRENGERIDDPSFAVLQVEDTGIPSVCYTALVDLVTDRWKYTLARTKAFATQLEPGQDRNFPMFRQHGLTSKRINRFQEGFQLLKKSRRGLT